MPRPPPGLPWGPTWEMILEALFRAFEALGIDIRRGKTWVTHQTDWVNGRRRTVRIGYDGEGHEIGRTVTEETDDGAGRTTTTTIFYDGKGHEKARMVEDKLTRPDGATVTNTTTTDAQGHVTGQTTTVTPPK